MSASQPLRDRVQSLSPEPHPPRPTTPLRITKQRDSPQPDSQPLSPRQNPSPRRQVAPILARRSSSSYKHVRENNLVTKSPFRSLLPQPSPRRVSGEKRPRPVSMTDQSENEHPLGFKRRQSKAFQGLLQKEPVTKSPFLRGSDSTPPEDHPPPVPPKPRPAMSKQPSAPSPARPSLVTRRLHGPRDAGGRRQRRKTVTWDPNCDVLEFDTAENDIDPEVFYSEDDYGVPSDEEMQDSFEYDSAPIADDSITGMVESMLEDNRPHTPPRLEDEEDAALLPPSPSPAKTRPAPSAHEHGEPPGDADLDAPVDPYSVPHLKDENPPFTKDESFQSIRSNDSDSLDPSNLSIGHSEVSLTNLDSQSLLADMNIPADDSIISSTSFAPQADSSPAGRLRSRSSTQEQSFHLSRDRSLEARSTPCINASRYNSPRPGSAAGSRSGSPYHQLFRPSSTSSLGSVGRRSSPFITPEGVQQRLQRKSQEALFSAARSNSGSPAPSPSLGKSRAEAGDGASAPNTQELQEETVADVSRATDPASERPTSPPVKGYRRVGGLHMMARGQNPTHDGVLSIDPEPQPIDPPRPTLPARAHSIDVGTTEDAPVPMDAKRAFEGLDLDFEHGFALGDEGMSVSAGLNMRSMVARHAGPSPGAGPAPGLGLGERAASAPAHASGVHLGDVSALDRLMEDMAQGAQMDTTADFSLRSDATTEAETEPGERSFASLRVEAVTEGVKAATFALPDIVRDDEEMKIDVDGEVRPPTPEGGWRAAGESRLNAYVNGNGKGKERESSAPPGPPAKDAIRAREELIKAKKREARRLEEGSDLDDEPLLQRKPVPPIGVGSPSSPSMLHPSAAAAASGGRPTRRRSMSTGDAEDILTRTPGAGQRRAAALRKEGLLDITALRGEDDPLADSINRELKKLEAPKRSKYHVREHSETIYATSDTERISHMNGAGDVDTGKAWKSVRRPSDMNEYAKQIKELRAQAGGKAHGKVFVRVINLRNLQVPIPSQPTAVTCTLNNGIHFVTTPEAALGQECRIDQEFELIEHSKLEFTLTIKVRRDPHIIAQFKANQPPPVARPPPQPLPPPASKGGQTHKSGGMRSFLGFGSPKKPKAILPPPAPALPPPPPQPQFRLQENLARYLKPDGSLARAFISFKDVAPHCGTRLLETAFPLIGQRLELDKAPKAMQVGEIVLQIFRLPPLHGIPPNQLPQSLEECHRGLSHVRWHKATYQQGTLTQSGGDCATWRRRHFRIIGANMIAFNDVTKRAITTIDLRKAIAVEDDHQSPVLSPASGATTRSHYDDDRMYGVERAFRLVFGPGPDQEITFFADTDAEKERWLEVLRAMVGRIPPNPLWAEMLWQQQEEQAKSAPPLPAGTQVPAARNPPR